MKVLVLTPRLPYPPAGGDKIMIYNHIRLLARRVERIHVLSFITSEAERKPADEFASKFPNLTVETVLHESWRSWANCAMGLLTRKPLQVHYYRSETYRRALEALLKRETFDAAVLHLVRMAQYLPLLNGMTTVLALSDCLTLRYERSAPYLSGMTRLIDGVERRRMAWYETASTAWASASFVHTERDRAKLIELGAKGRVAVINNGVDLEYFRPDPAATPETRTISFLGNLHSAPNRDAVRFLAGEVWPLVRERTPDARLQIIGINPTPRIRAWDGRNGVTVTGGVPDVRPYLLKSWATVCPIRIGAGIQNKILESLALGVPVVTTHIGFEGLGAAEGEGVLVADAPRDIAGAVLRLFKDPGERGRLAAAGRAFVEKQYNWDEKSAALLRLLRGEGA